MQYVRSLSGSVTKAWNSVNPATLSGAIDVIVVEQDNGDLACSPFHVRFGKFSLLRPSEKKVEFKVNGQKTDFAMKLGDGGEAFFVFETTGDVPEEMQTSPLVSPSASPRQLPVVPDPASLQEPEYLNITDSDAAATKDSASDSIAFSGSRRAKSDSGNTPLSSSPSDQSLLRPASGDWSNFNLERSASAEVLPTSTRRYTMSEQRPGRARSPPPLDAAAAKERALALSKKLSSSNIPTQITDRGDVMLDMTGYKMSDEDSLQAEVIARKILAEEIDGDYDIGALIAADRNGNLWIYSSEEAKEQAYQEGLLYPGIGMNGDAVSDAGYQSDDARSEDSGAEGTGKRQNLSTSPGSPPLANEQRRPVADPNKNYVKTLRLTSAQLKSLNLKPGPNPVSFSVNKATCNAFMYYWKYDVPIVISDIDGTITKSDALGHVLTMLGRDWTHLGVAKLYTDIASNGYHMLYLTSRSVGQADSTRNYLNGIVQDKYKLPKGPVIMSPDRTMAALRREVYLRKPEVFKMACLRDILNLFGPNHNPFYAGFGNRLTDALSYRSVNIPSTRIFTINSNAEVSLDLLTLTKYKSSYVSMRDLVDHFFPPVSLLNKEEEYTDFNYWREPVPDPDDFTDSEDEEEEKRKPTLPPPALRSTATLTHIHHEEEGEEDEEDEQDEEDEEEGDEAMGESYMTGMSETQSYIEQEGDVYEEGEEYDEEYDEEGDEDEEYDEEGEEEEYEEGNEAGEEAQHEPDEAVKDVAEPLKEFLHVDGVQSEAPGDAESDGVQPEAPGDAATDDKREPMQEAQKGAIGVMKERLGGAWMKNDVDKSMIGQMVDAVEKEITGVMEELGEHMHKLSAQDDNGFSIKDLRGTGSGGVTTELTEEGKKERHVATQML